MHISFQLLGENLTFLAVYFDSKVGLLVPNEFDML